MEIKNEIHKEKYEFVLSVNDNVICQRYFKINMFNEESIYSLQLLNAINDIVNLIDNDLKSKSRIYTWYMNHPDLSYPGDLECGKGEWSFWSSQEEVEPINPKWSTTFKFAFLIDEKEVISKIWDGSSYPRVVSDNVDIANKKVKIEASELNRANLETLIQRSMTIDKENLIPTIIRLICDATSTTYNNKPEYELSDTYSGKEYSFSQKENFYKLVAHYKNAPFVKEKSKKRF